MGAAPGEPRRGRVYTDVSLEIVGCHQSVRRREYEKAVYYPEDQRFLLQQDPNVTHYEVLSSPPG
jgi:hypothetical protein